jgi:hypothetical protein
VNIAQKIPKKRVERDFVSDFDLGARHSLALPTSITRASRETTIRFPDITPKKNKMLNLLQITRERIDGNPYALYSQQRNSSVSFFKGREPLDVAAITKNRIEVRMFKEKMVSKGAPPLINKEIQV